jgi:hypothetical protein
MSAWVISISDEYAEHWDIAAAHGAWDLTRRAAIEAGDAVIFWLGGQSIIAWVRVTSPAGPIPSRPFIPWRDHATSRYVARFTFTTMSEDPANQPRWKAIQQAVNMKSGLNTGRFAWTTPRVLRTCVPCSGPAQHLTSPDQPQREPPRSNHYVRRMSPPRSCRSRWPRARRHRRQTAGAERGRAAARPAAVPPYRPRRLQRCLRHHRLQGGAGSRGRAHRSLLRRPHTARHQRVAVAERPAHPLRSAPDHRDSREACRCLAAAARHGLRRHESPAAEAAGASLRISPTPTRLRGTAPCVPGTSWRRLDTVDEPGHADQEHRQASVLPQPRWATAPTA